MLRYWYLISSVTAVQLDVYTNASTLASRAALSMFLVPSTLTLKTLSWSFRPYLLASGGTSPAVCIITDGLTVLRIRLISAGLVISPVKYRTPGRPLMGWLRSRTCKDHSGCFSCNASTMAEPRKPVPPVMRILRLCIRVYEWTSCSSSNENHLQSLKRTCSSIDKAKVEQMNYTSNTRFIKTDLCFSLVYLHLSASKDTMVYRHDELGIFIPLECKQILVYD